jgi:hypothetical protein
LAVRELVRGTTGRSGRENRFVARRSRFPGPVSPFHVCARITRMKKTRKINLIDRKEEQSEGFLLINFLDKLSKNWWLSASEYVG